MKRLLYICCLATIVSCSSNGLNKPLTEALSVSELRKNLQKDKEFDKNYEVYRNIGDWISKDNMRLAKWGNISYRDYERYRKMKLPTYESFREVYEEKYPNAASYRAQADSLYNHYKSLRPDSLVTLEFKNKTVSGSSWFRCPVFNILVTPLKGTIDQFYFEYAFVSKIYGTKRIEDVSASQTRRGYCKRPVSSPSVISFNGDYVADILERVSSTELLRDYDFLYKITNIRYKGENWSDIPFELKWAIERDSVSAYDYEQIIKTMIDTSYISLTDYVFREHDEIRKQKEPNLHALNDEYWEDYYKQKYGI